MLQFRRLPEKELALFTFAVGVLRGVEPARWVGHLARDVVQRLLGHPAKLVVARHLPHLDQQPRQLRVIVQHLFKVWRQPALVHRIAMETAAQLVVHAAARHLPQAVSHHFQRLLAAGPVVITQQEAQRHGLGKLGRAAKAAVDGVEIARHAAESLVRDEVVQRAFSRAGRACAALNGGPQPAGALLDIVAPVAIGIGHGGQHAAEAGHAVAFEGREVGAAVERGTVRRQPDAHGPAALTGHGLHRLHVDPVQVRTLLTIDLDVDEHLVHQRCRLLVLEGLVFHDMAPVAG